MILQEGPGRIADYYKKNQGQIFLKNGGGGKKIISFGALEKRGGGSIVNHDTLFAARRCPVFRLDLLVVSILAL